MDQQKIIQLGDELYAALRGVSTVAPLTQREPTITLADAYGISRQLLSRRINDDGEQLVGKKIGISNKKVQKLFGVSHADFGFLTNAMSFPNGSVISLAKMTAPMLEVEIAFILKADLSGPNVDEQQVLAATEAVMPCFEIVDSRIENWNITLIDTVADNASSAAFVLGDGAVDPRSLDLPQLKITLRKNNQALSEGLGNAAMDNPLTAVAWLANALSEQGLALKAGEVILTGSLVPLAQIAAGDEFSLQLEGVGSASIRFVA